MHAGTKQDDFTRLDELFTHQSVPARLRQSASTSFEAASHFWQTALATEHLSPRIKELVLLALHASATAINTEAIRRQIPRATAAGASQADVLDVLLSIVGVSIHALYFAVPILLDELKAAGRYDEARLPAPRADIEAIREDFVRTRGFWNEQRDAIARLLPDYFKAVSELSMEPWKHGALTPKEREFMYIAIDCSVTHTYGPGLAMHIRHALKYGSTREEILAVFQLAGVMGIEGYILGAEAMLDPSNDCDVAPTQRKSGNLR